MRRIVLVFVLLMAVPVLATAQDWDLFTRTEDGYKDDFPATPRLTQTTWTT